VPDASEYIYVTYTNASGTETVLSSSQYSITINSVATGQIWASGFTLTYPTSGAPIANGTSLTVQRILPLQQLTSLENQGNFYPQAVEAGLDVLEMQIQQVSARTGSYRGVWATDVIYNFGDIVQDGVNGAYTNNIYVCVIANTSGTWATDLAAGDWSLALNVQSLIVSGSYLPLSGGTVSGNLAVTGTTTLAAVNASGTVSGAGFTTFVDTLLASPPAIGGTAAAAGSFTALSGSTSIKLNGSPVFDKLNIQKFTSSGTYTPTTGMVYATIECVGGGGGGGGVSGTGSGQTASAGGGGAGGYSRKTVTASTLGSSQTVTIGAAGSAGAAGNNAGGNGGTTSVGSLCVANGGTGGGYGAGSNPGGSGGLGGTAGTGDIAGTGQPGGSGSGANSASSQNNLPASGAGGSSFAGGGGISAVIGGTSGTTGNAGSGYGSGGSGAAAQNAGSNTYAGGAGTAGLVVITEYLSA
jgi:hypothetical protein